MDNVKFNSMEIKEGKTDLFSKPPLVYVELTQRCNCSCLMCYRNDSESAGMRDKVADMSRKDFELVSSELFKTAEVVDLRGFGETTIYPEFASILDYCRRSYPHIKYKLISNGKAINTELMRAMATLDLDLYISFDAAEKHLFEYLRRGNSYDAVIATINQWNGMFSKGNTARLHVTLHRHNCFHLTEIARFAATSNCRLLSISEIDPLTGSEWLVDQECAAHEIVKCAEVCASAGIDLVIPAIYFKALTIMSNWKTVAITKCLAPWNTILVKYDGEIYSCSHRFSSMGNMVRRPFPEIWNGDHFKLLRSEGDHMINACTGCNRNSLVYIGTQGSIRETTWRILDQQQTYARAINERGQLDV